MWWDDARGLSDRLADPDTADKALVLAYDLTPRDSRCIDAQLGIETLEVAPVGVDGGLAPVENRPGLAPMCLLLNAQPELLSSCWVHDGPPFARIRPSFLNRLIMVEP
jgi:hypothetical protein